MQSFSSLTDDKPLTDNVPPESLDSLSNTVSIKYLPGDSYYGTTPSHLSYILRSSRESAATMSSKCIEEITKQNYIRADRDTICDELFNTNIKSTSS